MSLVEQDMLNVSVVTLLFWNSEHVLLH
jgi:hypothetical protein